MRIFAILGPFLAWLISIAFLFAAAHPKPVFEDDRYWISSFMVCYAFSIAPLLLAAWIDRRLAGNWWRSLACFAAGFAIAVVLFYILTHEGGRQEDIKGFHQYWFNVGLVWGLPAAVCSWLVGMTSRPETGKASGGSF